MVGEVLGSFHMMFVVMLQTFVIDFFLDRLTSSLLYEFHEEKEKKKKKN
jgi:hypothetical protein